jgi:hypothetical protein
MAPRAPVAALIYIKHQGIQGSAAVASAFLILLISDDQRSSLSHLSLDGGFVVDEGLVRVREKHERLSRWDTVRCYLSETSVLVYDGRDRLEHTVKAHVPDRHAGLAKRSGPFCSAELFFGGPYSSWTAGI